MKKTIITLLIVAMIGVAAWFIFFHKREKPVVLETEHPQYGYIANSVTATGTIQPVDTVTVGSQISGTIQKVFVDFNSTVKQGQLLAQIDKTLLQAQVNQNAAAVREAKSNYELQKKNYDRENELLKSDVISKSEFETATEQYQTAKASVDAAAAQLQAAQKNLSLTDIYSPINGVVLTRNVSVGQTVAASFSTPTLFVIAKDLTKMQVRANIDEADIGNVQINQRASFNVDAFPNDVFTGTVQEIRLEPSVSSNVVTYTTIIEAPNDNKKLKPGMTANVSVYTKEDTNALLIPAKALKFKPDSATMAKQYVIQGTNTDTSKNKNRMQKRDSVHRDSSSKRKDSLLRKDESIQKATVWIKRGDSLIQKHIRIGMNDGINVQVISGLSVNDEVITGVQDVTAKNNKPANNNQQPKSPFMPQRPGGARNR